jgi:hypothetical protein
VSNHGSLLAVRPEGVRHNRLHLVLANRVDQAGALSLGLQHVGHFGPFIEANRPQECALLGAHGEGLAQRWLVDSVNVILSAAHRLVPRRPAGAAMERIANESVKPEPDEVSKSLKPLPKKAG